MLRIELNYFWRQADKIFCLTMCCGVSLRVCPFVLYSHRNLVTNRDEWVWEHFPGHQLLDLATSEGILGLEAPWTAQVDYCILISELMGL